VSGSFKKVHLHNYRGGVEVIGEKETGQIVLEAKRHIKSASKERLAEAGNQIYFDTLVHQGELYFFIQDPDRHFSIDENGAGGYHSENWNQSRSKEARFEIKYEFTLKLILPDDLSIDVYNHEKNLSVKNIHGEILARNHHDDVFVSGASDNVKALSHHGDVTIEFIRNPADWVVASTHHGDIRLALQPSPSAEVSLQSHHGSYFTDFDFEPLPILVSAEATPDGKRYRVGNSTRVRLGSGQCKMDMKTYHGDVFINTVQ
jgi:hypothetical protein